jgi:DNA-binding transcriptional regulator YdaS (Cro superfamily)
MGNNRHMNTQTPFAVWACTVHGRKAILARALGVNRSTITHWSNGTKKIPPDRCPAIEQLTKIKCKDLRPDLFGAKKMPRKQ